MIGLGSGYLSYFTDSVSLPKSDTIKVIMLVCDTAKSGRWVDSAIHGSILTEVGRHEGNYNQFVYWQFGYEVHEQSNYLGSDKWYYLDEKKTPLRKSVIVWDAKQIHQPLP